MLIGRGKKSLTGTLGAILLVTLPYAVEGFGPCALYHYSNSFLRRHPRRRHSWPTSALLALFSQTNHFKTAHCATPPLPPLYYLYPQNRRSAHSIHNVRHPLQRYNGLNPRRTFPPLRNSFQRPPLSRFRSRTQEPRPCSAYSATPRCQPTRRGRRGAPVHRTRHARFRLG